MIRKLNYTGRKKLLKEDTQIILYEREGELPFFDVSLNLRRYELPDDALVFVEAYQQTTLMRFDFGTVGCIKPVSDCRLGLFDSVEGVLFRVKVTSPALPQGKLLAEGDQIRFCRSEEQPDDRLPLLPVKPQDIGNEIAKLDFSEEQPLLLVNFSAGDWQEIARSPAFAAFVYPQSLREILCRILISEEHDDTEDPDDWRSKWLRFAVGLPGVNAPPDAESDDNQKWDWIEDAVSSFATKLCLLDRFQEYWREENSR